MTAYNFGVIVGCSDRDLFLLKGCIESVKESMNNCAIALLYDGYHRDRLENIVKNYNVIDIIDRDKIDRALLRELSFGYGLTKMLSFWYSPFEKFLYLDSDIIMCGNIMNNLDLDDYDISVSQIEDFHDTKWVTNYFYDKNLLKQYFPEYDQNYYDRYLFCTGVFFSKKHVIDVYYYESMLHFIKENPDVFKCGDQGLLNYMLLSLLSNNKIRIGRIFNQILVNDYDTKKLLTQYPLASEAYKKITPCILHYAGEKPIVYRTGMSPYMKHYRVRYLTNNYKLNVLLAYIALYIEDLPTFIIKIKGKIIYLYKKFLTAK